MGAIAPLTPDAAGDRRRSQELGLPSTAMVARVEGTRMTDERGASMAEPVCPDCEVDLRQYGRYLVCPDCDRTYREEAVEVRYRPVDSPPRE